MGLALVNAYECETAGTKVHQPPGDKANDRYGQGPLQVRRDGVQENGLLGAGL